MPPRCHLIPWNRPLLPQAVTWLAAGWPGDRPLDLAKQLIVVPTRQAGRRLREALAAYAAQHGQAVFPPRVVTPETLVTLGAPADGSATHSESRLAWAEVLRAARPEDFRAVFPRDPPARDFAWARRLADQLMRLQATLAETAFRIGDVPRGAGGDFPETERWVQLAELERRYDAALARRGRCDAQAAKIAWAGREKPWPVGVEKITILATPDPLPLAVRVLEQLAVRGSVEVVMFGDDEKMFDQWGRPPPDAWARRDWGRLDFEQRVHLCASPSEQAGHIVALAKKYATPEGVLALGVGDGEVLAPLEGALSRAGVAAFNPAGQLRQRDALYALLVALADFAREDSLAHATALARCPDVLAWIEIRARGGDFSPARVLVELDVLHARHLPPTLSAAQGQCTKHDGESAGKFPAAGFALDALAGLRVTLTHDEFPANAAAALAEIFAGQRIETDAPLAESAAAWRETLRETGEALEKFPGVTRAEGWELALEAFAAATHADEKPAGALELNGWLELLWEDAPHLVVAGLNDGSVPDAVVGEMFLPEALRGRLGLKTNAMRFARDAYLLAALTAWRGGGAGRLDVLVGKASAAGDPLRPSRLLLQCADEALPARVKFLFREIEVAQASLPWARAWRLRPKRIAPPEKISVTALRDWLACPFRFYLKHVLRMEHVAPEKAELDAMDFGTLLHAALQAMGEDEALRDCTDEATLRTGLLAVFERRARAQFGSELPLPLVVQLASARQRLAASARVQARERAAGWRIERVEWKFECVLGRIAVRGKIDRIDRHVVTGARRVLDYKTSDTASSPEHAHLGPISDAVRPPWTRVTVSGRERAWLDLQLPLYRRAVTAEFGMEVACGYFNLPKAAGETAVVLWDGLNASMQSAAEECAKQAAGAIAAGEFWPPVESGGRDEGEWAELFHHGAAASVEWPEPASSGMETESQKVEGGGP